MSCFTVTEQEDKINISIQGLTKKQKMMLNIMWSIDSREQMQYWINSLTECDRKIAASLLIILKHEILEELMNDEMFESKEILNKFTSME